MYVKNILKNPKLEFKTNLRNVCKDNMYSGYLFREMSGYERIANKYTTVYLKLKLHQTFQNSFNILKSQ